jgi:RHS repeat-associated protein
LTATPGSSLIEGTVNELSNVTVNGQAAPLAFSAAAPYGFQKELNLPPGGQVITIQSTDGSANSAQKSYTLTVRGDYALAYDVNGNLFTKTWRQAGNSGVDWVKETYEWDKENRLTGWTKERLLVTGVQTAAVLASATWTYDGLGRRVKEQNVAGAAVTNTHFVWDGLTLVQWQNTTGVAQRNLFDEGEHDVITGEKLIYVRDHLGSVRGWHRLSDGARGEADYSAWGVRTVVSNTTGTLPVRSFTGHYQHAASGLVLAPYRGYDAELGRWLSEDPLDNAELIEGANLYRYVQNTPVNMIDPDGRGAVGFFIRALKGGWRAVTPGRARKAIAAGDDVLTKGCGKSGAAKKLAKDTFGDKTVRHDPRAPGQKPHYQHKNGGRGHIFYGIASGLTLEYWAKPESKDPYAAKIGCAVDFFNPLSIGKDVMDLFGAGDDE